MDQKFLEDNVPGYRELMLRFRISGDGLLFGPVPPMDTSASPPESEPEPPLSDIRVDTRLARALSDLGLEGDDSEIVRH